MTASRAPDGFRSLGGIEIATFIAVAAVAIARAPGAAGWTGAEGAVGAATLSTSPGHGAGAVALGALAGLIPVGELAFRVALVGAVALAALAAGLVALARALVPTAAAAGVIAAALLAVSPAAAATAASGEGAVAAALAVWALVLVVRDARRGQDDDWSAAPASAASALVGALAAFAPLVALAAAVPVVRLWWCVPARRRALGLVPAAAALAILTLPLVLRGEAPGMWALLGGSDGAGRRLIALAGDGTGVVLLFAGLVGLGLGAATGLRGAATVLGVAAAAAIAVVVSAPPAFTLVPLALVAAGVAPLAAAAARLGPEEHRALIATIAAVPVAVIAAVAPVRAPEVPAGDEDATAMVAADLLAPVRGGSGVFVATAPAIGAALAAERALAGLRADLVLVSELSSRGLAAELRAQRVVASDRTSFGELDPRRSLPAGRGFELMLQEPADEPDAPPPPPAIYPGAAGRAVAAMLATERARREAARGHLDRAARAAGLAGTRFGAADLALLAAAVPGNMRPAMFGFVPALSSGALPPPWLPALFGDDLAWVAGLADEPLAADAPPERRLHALWREVLAGRRPPGDPAILAFGIAAGRATARMLADLDRLDAAIDAANATLELGRSDAPTLLTLGSALAARGRLGDSQPPDATATTDLRAAETALGRAIVVDPQLVDAHVVLGLVQARLGRLDEARATWRRGLTVAPGHPELVQLLK